MSLDTDWQIIQTAAAGIKPQGLQDPIQAFRVRRIEHTVLVDLNGLPLAEGRGRANLGILPDWALAAIPQQEHLVNDHPTSLHTSICAVHRGRILYWEGQVVEGRIMVNRPPSLHGGFEFTTVTPFPHDLLPSPPAKERSAWMR